MLLNKLVCAVGAVVMAGALTFAVGRVASEAPGAGGVPQAAASGAGQPPVERPKADDRAALIKQAKEELRQKEVLLEIVEKQYSQELTDARLKLRELEQQLREDERRREFKLARVEEMRDDFEVAKWRERVTELTRLIQNQREAERLNAKGETNPASVTRLLKERSEAQAKLQEESKRLAESLHVMREDIERLHSRDSLEHRRLVLRAEESLRLLERRAERETDRAKSAVDAAAARVLQLEGIGPTPEPSGRPNSQLERKLDELLREVTDLKREVKRLREGK
jgi:hypothetical protein